MVPLYISVSEKNVLCIRFLPCASTTGKNDPAKRSYYFCFEAVDVINLQWEISSWRKGRVARSSSGEVKKDFKISCYYFTTNRIGDLDKRVRSFACFPKERKPKLKSFDYNNMTLACLKHICHLKTQLLTMKGLHKRVHMAKAKTFGDAVCTKQRYTSVTCFVHVLRSRFCHLPLQFRRTRVFLPRKTINGLFHPICMLFTCKRLDTEGRNS